MRLAVSALLFFLALTIASSARAQYEPGGNCGDRKDFETDVALNVELPEPYYRLDMSRDEINEFGRKGVDEWLKKNNMTGIWSANDIRTEGYAAGAWASIYKMSSKAVPYDVYGAVFCPFMERIEINLMFRTMIVIPKEYKDKPCRFGLIKTHELRHYYANRHAVEMYVAKLKHDFPAIVAEVEKEPVSRGDVQDKFKDMQQAIKDLVQVYFAQGMGKEMRELNSQIDSPEEYEIRGLVQHDCEGG